MDPGTGKLQYVDSETKAKELGLAPVRRDLTDKEKADMQIRLYSPCACGSGKKFKFCCKTRARSCEVPVDDNAFVKQITEIFQACAHKQPDELTDLERTAVAIAAGCEWERTDTGVRLKNPISIRKLDGRFVVEERRDLQQRGTK